MWGHQEAIADVNGEVLFNGNQPDRVGRVSALRSALPHRPKPRCPCHCCRDKAMLRRNPSGKRLLPATLMRAINVTYCYWPFPLTLGHRHRPARTAHGDGCLVTGGLSLLHNLAISKTSDDSLADYVETKFSPLIEKGGNPHSYRKANQLPGT